MVDRIKAEALGIHSKVVRTWDVNLKRLPRLLVPIFVDALVVRTERTDWADCRMRTPEEGGSTRSIDLLPPPFVDREQARPRGVHLHWAVPDALTKLRASGAPAPPTLPDRWLVVRLSPGRLGRRAVHAWVVDARSATAVPLDDWLAAAPEGPPLTALGGGDAGWTAYYDNVLNRLAFHDPLDGVSKGPVSYLVCGWYADADADPLASGTSTLAAFEARLAALGWSLNEDDLEEIRQKSTQSIKKAVVAGLATPHATLDSSGEVTYAKKAAPLDGLGRAIAGAYAFSEVYWPQVTLMHGAIVDIPWPNLAMDSPEVGRPTADDVSVAIGITPGDTLGALIAEVSGASDDAEWLTAFAVGAIEELESPDGDVKIADRLHDATFTSIGDGSETVSRTSTVVDDRPSERKVRAGRQPPKEKPRSKASLRERWQAKASGFRGVHKSPPFKKPEQETREVTLPRPRLYKPADPVLAVHAARRSPKHGEDGSLSADGLLMCRVSSRHVKAVCPRVSPSGAASRVCGKDFLDRPLLHGGIPPECEELLEEMGLLDPGSGLEIAVVAHEKSKVQDKLPQADVIENVRVEQTAWWAVRRVDADQRALMAYSGIEGTLPSALAVRPATEPWVPLHLDWEVEFLPAKASDWTLTESDFAPPDVPESGEVLQGRSLLSAGVAKSLAHAVRAYLENEAASDGNELNDADNEEELLDLATRLEQLDILSGPIERFHQRLRRDRDISDAAPDTPAPEGFIAVRAGFLRLRRVRLVDAFGQTLFLAGSSSTQAADPQRIAVGASGRIEEAAGVLSLPPRFTAPSKLEFRFRDSKRREADATEARTPVVGWLLPDHLDGALEVFDAEGTALGQLLLDPDHGSAWEPAPGRLAAVGESPRSAIAAPELAAMVQAVFDRGAADLEAGRKPALAELLRAIDSTRWSVDPFAHTGEEHLALLVGHPIAVVAASVMVEVRETVPGTDVPITRVPVRLGSLSHWEDGLFGYFVNGNVERFRVAHAAAALARPAPFDGFAGAIDSVPGYTETFADDVSEGGAGSTPVEHAYVDASSVLWVVPGVRYELLLLVEPHCAVHATTGLLPRKSLTVQREWMAPALSKMAPTFRFGPVLRDPKKIRMPIPADIGGAWTWTHRADVDRWSEEEVIHAGQEALLAPDPVTATEGWLKLTPKPEGEG